LRLNFASMTKDKKQEQRKRKELADQKKKEPFQFETGLKPVPKERDEATQFACAKCGGVTDVRESMNQEVSCPTKGCNERVFYKIRPRQVLTYIGR